MEKKTEFYHYYPDKELNKNRIAVQVALQNSLENLVKKGLIITFGHKTFKKWYINKIKLTQNGKKIARALIKDRQRRLPIK